MTLNKTLKKAWDAVSTGWVVEYPSNNGPEDFFNPGAKRKVQPKEVESDMPPAYKVSSEEDARADAIFKWREQMDQKKAAPR